MFKVEPPEMLVDTILPRKTLTGLTAMPGAGKTWFTLELSRAVATGKKFLGHFQSQVGNVVYVGQDSSVHDYAQQLRKLIKPEFMEYEEEVAKGLRHANPFDDRLHFIIQPGLFLEDKKSVVKLASTILRIKHSEYDYTEHRNSFSTGDRVPVQKSDIKSGADLIVLDTLSSMLRVDQLDNTTMEVPIRNCRWLASITGACVVLIHHNSYPSDTNDGERWRGASAQVAALDNWFHIAKPPAGSKGGHMLLKCKRFRGLTPPDFHYDMTIDATSAKLVYAEGNINKEPTLVVDSISEHDVVDLLTDEWQSRTSITGRMKAKVGELYSLKQITDSVLHILDTCAGIEKGPGRSGYRRRMHDGETNANS
jgi:hypothetical protein